MKQLLVILLLCFSFISNAQETDLYEKGGNMIGVSFGGSFADAQTNSYGVIHARYGKFIADQIQLGAEVGYAKLGSFTNAIEFGPYLRAYLIPNAFSPIVEVNFSRGQVTQEVNNSNSTGNYNKLGIDAGFSYNGATLGNLGFEAIGEYYFFLNSNNTQNGALIFVGRITGYF